MRKNKLKQMFKEGKPVINGWLQIPSAFSAEVMAHQGWDSCTIDMQHGVIDYPNALSMLQSASGRFECVKSVKNIIGIVDYAHTEDALFNVCLLYTSDAADE